MTEKKLEDKTINELTAEDFPKIKVQFAPGAFDDFEGSQAELDELMAQIQSMISDGSLFSNSRSVDIDELEQSDNPEDQRLLEKLSCGFDKESPRVLQ